MTRRFRLPALLSTAVVAATLILAPAAAASASRAYSEYFSTKKQCLYSQDQLHKLGYHIDYACYPSAGAWYLVFE